jgi:hypothetical protein
MGNPLLLRRVVQLRLARDPQANRWLVSQFFKLGLIVVNRFWTNLDRQPI